MGMIFLCLGY